MKPSKLSYHLKKELLTSNKIELTFKEIDILDYIPLKLSNITHLDLSFNNLTILDGIEQFTNLLYLNIANNQIRSLLNLAKISNKESLSVLIIKGNPAARHPNLAPIIMNYFPSIREIDGEVLNYSTQKDIMQAMELSSSLIPYLYINEQFILKIHKEIVFYQLKNELFETVWPQLPKSTLPSPSDIKQLNIKLANKYREITTTQNEGKIRPITVLEFMQKIQEQLNINSAHLEEEIVCKIYKWLYCEIILYLHSQGNVDLQCFLQTYEEPSIECSEDSENKVDGITSDLMKFSQLSHYPQSLLHFPVFGCNTEYMKALYAVLNKQISVLQSLLRERKSILLNDFGDFCDEIQSPPSKISYPSIPSHEYCSPSVLKDMVSPSSRILSSGNSEINQFLSPKFRQETGRTDKKLAIDFIKEELVSKLDFEDESDMNITNSYEELSQTIEELLRDDDKDEEKYKNFYKEKILRKCLLSWKRELWICKVVRMKTLKRLSGVLKIWKKYVVFNVKVVKRAEILIEKRNKKILLLIIGSWKTLTQKFSVQRDNIAMYFYEKFLKSKSIRGFLSLLYIKDRNSHLSLDQYRCYLLKKAFKHFKIYLTVFLAKKKKIRQYRIRSMKITLKKILKSWLYLVRPSAKFIKKSSQETNSQLDKLLLRIKKKDQEIAKTFKKYKKKLK